MNLTQSWRYWTAALVLAGLVMVGTRLTAVHAAGNAAAKQAASDTSAQLPQWQIQEHFNRVWLRDTITHGLVDYWVKYSVAPNGFVQEDLDRTWHHWGNQEEATINGQGRQLLSMTLVYDMNGRTNKQYLDAMTRAADFLLKMRDPKYGGYYLRVGSDGHVIETSKTGYQSFALYSLAMMGQATGNRKYTDAATQLFRVIRDKMTDGPFFGAGGSYTRDWKKIPGGPFGGGRGANRRAGFVDAMGWSSGYSPQELLNRPSFAGLFGKSKPAHCIDLHMFEALLGLYEATRSPEVWKEIDVELNGISDHFDYKLGYLPQCWDASWNPLGPPTANPGHFLFEWASELSRAVDLGADPKFIGLGNRILNLAVTTYEPAIGGLGGYNAKRQPAPMLWWPQCEVIKASAMYAILHGRDDLWPYFHETFDFVRNNYFDTKDGGWFEWYLPGGKTRTEQGERAFYKGSVDGPEWGSYHQTKLAYELWRITAPDYKPWPRHP